MEIALALGDSILFASTRTIKIFCLYYIELNEMMLELAKWVSGIGCGCAHTKCFSLFRTLLYWIVRKIVLNKLANWRLMMMTGQLVSKRTIFTNDDNRMKMNGLTSGQFFTVPELICCSRWTRIRLNFIRPVDLVPCSSGILGWNIYYLFGLIDSWMVVRCASLAVQRRDNHSFNILLANIYESESDSCRHQ